MADLTRGLGTYKRTWFNAFNPFGRKRVLMTGPNTAESRQARNDAEDARAAEIQKLITQAQIENPQHWEQDKARIESDEQSRKEVVKHIRRVATKILGDLDLAIRDREEKQRAVDRSVNGPPDVHNRALAALQAHDTLIRNKAQEATEAQIAFMTSEDKWRDHATPCWRADERLQFEKLTELEDISRDLANKIDVQQLVVDRELHGINDKTPGAVAPPLDPAFEKLEPNLLPRGGYKHNSRRHRRSKRNKSRKMKAYKKKNTLKRRSRKLIGGSKAQNRLSNLTAKLRTSQSLYQSLRKNYTNNPGHWSDFNWRHRAPGHPDGTGNLYRSGQGNPPCYNLPDRIPANAAGLAANVVARGRGNVSREGANRAAAAARLAAAAAAPAAAPAPAVPGAAAPAAAPALPPPAGAAPALPAALAPAGAAPALPAALAPAPATASLPAPRGPRAPRAPRPPPPPPGAPPGAPAGAPAGAPPGAPAGAPAGAPPGGATI